MKVEKGGGGRRGGERVGHSHQEIYEQVCEVRDMLVVGQATHRICRIMAERHGLGRRTAEGRIAAARKMLKDDVKTLDRKVLAAQLMATYAEILRKAQESNQLSSALGAVAGIARLTGLEGDNNSCLGKRLRLNANMVLPSCGSS